MSRLEWSFKFFSKQGIKFLFFELIIVFLGVYLAFLFQSYSENQKIESEREKILISLKEDLEYFRIFFTDYASKDQIEEWQTIVNNGQYVDYSNWRFIQPQYDYTSIEYALRTNANVLNFELNALISEIYMELEKLKYTEDLITGISMSYTAIPQGSEDDPQIQLADHNNLLNFQRFISRYEDRASIMIRIAEACDEHLPLINNQFKPKQLKEIELALITNYLSSSNQSLINQYIPVLLQFFPKLTEDEIRTSLTTPEN